MVRAGIRQVALGLCGSLVVAVCVGVFTEFFVEYAKEKGLYENPSQRVDAVLTTFSGFVLQTWFLCLASASAGLAAGSWLDAKLKRQDRDSAGSLTAKAGREALAQEADKLASEVATLVATHDTSLRMLMVGSVDDPYRRQEQLERTRGQLREAYAQKHYSRVQQVFTDARKVISVNDDRYGWVSHSLKGYDLDEMPGYLAKLAADLRDPRPYLPAHSPRTDQSQQALRLRSPLTGPPALPSLQPPPSPATKSRP